MVTGDGAEGRGPTAPASVLRWLARRPRTEAEARERLSGEGLRAEQSEAVLAEWRRLGYLDDRRLAYNYLSARSERRLQGRRRLTAELARRGIPQDILDAVAGEAVDDGAEQRNLLRLLDRKLAAEGPPRDSRARGRLERFLTRRGFHEEAVRRALAPFRREGADDDLDRDP